MAWIEIFVCHHIVYLSLYTVTLRTAPEIITILLFIEDLFYARWGKVPFRY